MTGSLSLIHSSILLKAPEQFHTNNLLSQFSFCDRRFLHAMYSPREQTKTTGTGSVTDKAGLDIAALRVDIEKHIVLLRQHFFYRMQA